MSELFNAHDNRATIRWKLLTGTSAIALSACISVAVPAIAAETDRATVWIDLGGGLEGLASPGEQFSPDFLSSVTIPAQRKTLDVQSPPAYGLEEDAKISFEPENSNWIFSGAVRFGRSNASRSRHQQTANAKIPENFYVSFFNNYHKYGSFYPYRHVRYAEASYRESEHHTIIDFTAGQDVGLGMLGLKGSSVLGAGVRIAQLSQKSSTALRVLPDLQYPTAPVTSLSGLFQFKYVNTVNFHSFHASEEAKRGFRGIGPTVTWNASAPIAGSGESGLITLDWGLNASVLFGRQSAKGRHETNSQTYHMTRWITRGGAELGHTHLGYFDNVNAGKCGTGGHPTYCNYQARYQETSHATNSKTNSANFGRSRSVTVPNIGAFASISYRYSDAKMSLGYRADLFFNAIDGGIDTRKEENRGFFGPFASISIGIGN
jgi:iron complex outermembrane recepter protein